MSESKSNVLDAEIVTLGQLARAAGVSTYYLRSLVKSGELERAFRFKSRTGYWRLRIDDAVYYFTKLRGIRELTPELEEEIKERIRNA